MVISFFRIKRGELKILKKRRRVSFLQYFATWRVKKKSFMSQIVFCKLISDSCSVFWPWQLSVHDEQSPQWNEIIWYRDIIWYRNIILYRDITFYRDIILSKTDVRSFCNTFFSLLTFFILFYQLLYHNTVHTEYGLSWQLSFLC